MELQSSPALFFFIFYFLNNQFYFKCTVSFSLDTS